MNSIRMAVIAAVVLILLLSRRRDSTLGGTTGVRPMTTRVERFPMWARLTVFLVTMGFLYPLTLTLCSVFFRGEFDYAILASVTVAFFAVGIAMVVGIYKARMRGRIE